MTDTATHTLAAEYLDAERRLLDRYELTAERWTVDVGAIDGQVSGLVAGHGPDMLMVVGGGPPAGIWIPVMAELTGMRLHAIDLPGMGLTSPVEWSVETHRSTAVALLDGVMAALDLDSTLVAGQSIGGLWSLWFALDRPDRVRALSLLSCPATLLGTSAPLPLRLLTVPGLGPLVQRLDQPTPRQVDRFIRTAGETLENQDELRALFLAVERLPTYARSLRDLVRATVRVRGAQPAIALTEEDLRQVTMPVQLIWGDHDPFGPPDVGWRATEVIPDAELHVVPGGHGFWVDRPAEIAQLMTSFLGSVGSEGASVTD